MRLLVLEELVQSVGLKNLLRLIGEQHRVAVKSNTQLSLRHFGHLLRGEHGGRCYTWCTQFALNSVSGALTHVSLNQNVYKPVKGTDSPLLVRFL